MRFRLTHEGVLVKLANHYTTQGTHQLDFLVIYLAFILDVALGHMNGALSEIQTYS